MKIIQTSLIILFTINSALLKSQTASGFFPEKDLMTVGIYYYPEHWDSAQWDRDLKNISDMGFEFVHLAEFSWTLLEPVEGKYDFSWLDKVVTLCEKHNLKILMCTPSATTPAWMRYKYPETFIMYGNYIRAEHGTRGLGSIVNPLYHQFVENIVTQMAKRYGQKSSVTGWQLDNEPDAKPDYSPSSQAAFRQWLIKKYVTIDALNFAWGTNFWSQRYQNFEEILIPNTYLVNWWGNNPSSLLDFKRYCADAQAEFLDFQASVLKKYITSSQYITTNYTAVSRGADPVRAKMLDFATFTAYPNEGQENIGNQGFRLGDSRLMTFANDYYRNITGITGIMELQPGPVNWGGVNPLLLPGTVRMWLWQNFGSGSILACSYRYKQILSGAEQYFNGIMKTDGVTPYPGGEEYRQFMSELKQLRKIYKPGTQMPENIKARSAAILWNHENYWSLDRQKQTYQWDSWGFPIKYHEILKSFGAPVDVIKETTDLSAYKFVIVPAYEIADSALVKKWTNYVIGGGNLIITCRTATKGRNGHFWQAETAAPISDLIGAHIKGSDMLPSSAKAEVTYKNVSYSWNNWADLLEPNKNTEVLATYSNQFYAGKAAVVKHSIGEGSVVYIGLDTDDSQLEKDILRDIYSTAGVSTESYPKGVFVFWRDGFNIAVNYSSDDYSVEIPGNAHVFIGEHIVKPAGVFVWE